VISSRLQQCMVNGKVCSMRHQRGCHHRGWETALPACARIGLSGPLQRALEHLQRIYSHGVLFERVAAVSLYFTVAVARQAISLRTVLHTRSLTHARTHAHVPLQCSPSMPRATAAMSIATQPARCCWEKESHHHAAAGTIPATRYTRCGGRPPRTQYHR
jgi:hypothetical protein